MCPDRAHKLVTSTFLIHMGDDCRHSPGLALARLCVYMTHYLYHPFISVRYLKIFSHRENSPFSSSPIHTATDRAHKLVTSTFLIHMGDECRRSPGLALARLCVYMTHYSYHPFISVRYLRIFKKAHFLAVSTQPLTGHTNWLPLPSSFTWGMTVDIAPAWPSHGSVCI